MAAVEGSCRSCLLIQAVGDGMVAKEAVAVRTDGVVAKETTAIHADSVLAKEAMGMG